MSSNRILIKIEDMMNNRSFFERFLGEKTVEMSCYSKATLEKINANMEKITEIEEEERSLHDFIIECIKTKAAKEAAEKKTLEEEAQKAGRKLAAHKRNRKDEDDGFTFLHFVKKNGQVKAAAFYEYAKIDKTTWNDIENKTDLRLEKKTLWKLILALEVDVDTAQEIMTEFGWRINARYIQDRILLSIMEVRKEERLTTTDLEMILADFQEIYQKTEPFDSIYETARQITVRKKSIWPK